MGFWKVVKSYQEPYKFHMTQFNYFPIGNYKEIIQNKNIYVEIYHGDGHILTLTPV
jgi:hypothetical protein